jgi:FkbM family methyltransferase
MKIYIEAGANDGVFQSCTYKLEQTGEWTGVLIEPNLDVFNACVANRSSNNYFYNCALVSFEYDKKVIPFHLHSGHSAMGGVFKRTDTEYTATIDVPCRTLQSILDELEIYKIDKLFLDVEGFELDVLKGIDFSKTLIEEAEIEVHSRSVINYKDNNNEKENIVYFMRQNNYEVISENDPSDANTKLIFRPV